MDKKLKLYSYFIYERKTIFVDPQLKLHAECVVMHEYCLSRTRTAKLYL